MKRLVTLTIQYYRLLLLYNIAFSLLAAFIFMVGLGSINPASIPLIKIIGFSSAIALHYYLANAEYYYFRNAGCRIRTMFIAAFSIDILVSFSIIILFKI